MTESNARESARTAVLIDVLYAVAIGINVWLLLDAATGGQLSRDTRVMVARVTEDWRKERAAKRQLRHDTFEVVQQATDIVKEA